LTLRNSREGFVEPAGRVTCGDVLESGLEGGEGLDAIDLCCGDEQSDVAPSSAAFIMVGEEGVLGCSTSERT
tara:strand:- start:1969 stop:2184 length:216 start_codon:yes stop_codon:yes gene_type:complete